MPAWYYRVHYRAYYRISQELRVSSSFIPVVTPVLARYYRTAGTTGLQPVLPLRVSLRAEKAHVPCNLIHPPTPLVNTINRTPFAQIWERLCFDIRVELGSPPQDGLLPPLVGMVPPLVEKIPLVDSRPLLVV